MTFMSFRPDCLVLSAKRKGFNLSTILLNTLPGQESMSIHKDGTAYPVRYMVVKKPLRRNKYKVIDTSLEGNGRTVCSSGSVRDAHYVARCLNRQENYTYPDRMPGEYTRP